MPPIKLNTNLRDIDLVLQPTVTNRIFKGPRINLSQVKKNITIPLILVTFGSEDKSSSRSPSLPVEEEDNFSTS